MEKNELTKLISEIGHPAINLSLRELGIINKIEINNNEVNIEYAFPFLNIPIKDILIDSVKNTVERNNYKFKYSIRTMTEEELKTFMKLENKNWKQ